MWPSSQNGATLKWFTISKGLHGAGPSGIIDADGIITEAGVPVVNPSNVVSWDVNGFQKTAKTSTTAGVSPSPSPPCWTGFVPLAAYLLMLEKKLFDPSLLKSLSR
ncbi:hypothetical protein MKX01_011537 [Papaver californicum]|nr:hypothetical protein MKX01_011537 [Papaver californicum]